MSPDFDEPLEDFTEYMFLLILPLQLNPRLLL